MPQRTFVERVEILEGKMEGLETLPARVASLDTRVASLESQIVQLRDEMRTEFSATRTGLRTELRAEIRAGDEETRRYMRVLHEDVIARLAAIQEGKRRRKTR